MKNHLSKNIFLHSGFTVTGELKILSLRNKIHQKAYVLKINLN